jgi:hypothetical protein
MCNVLCCYTTGGYDIALLQYNSAGSLLSTILEGSVNTDVGYGVSASADGKYVYVTGEADASINGQPYVGNREYKFLLIMLLLTYVLCMCM